MNDLITIIDEQREQFSRVAAVKSIEFEREKGFALQILRANDYVMKVAMNNKASLQNAIVNVAAIGVSLNPASKLAYLVPRNGAICLDISYMGLMNIAQECGAILWGQAQIVRKADKFELREIGKQPLHEFDPFSTERGDITGVYVVVKTDTGDFLTHAMAISKVYEIRNRSEAFKKGSGPWKTDEEEMIKKTCVKQAAKMWPRRERLDGAVHYLNTDGGEGITLTPNKMPAEEYEQWVTKIQSADTKEASKAEWRKAVAICRDLGDVDSAERLKIVMLRHALVLDGKNPDEPEALAA